MKRHPRQTQEARSIHELQKAIAILVQTIDGTAPNLTVDDLQAVALAAEAVKQHWHGVCGVNYIPTITPESFAVWTDSLNATRRYHLQRWSADYTDVSDLWEVLDGLYHTVTGRQLHQDADPGIPAKSA